MSKTYEQLEPVIQALDDRIKTNSGALAEKADSSDVTALGTRVTSVEGNIDALDEAVNGITVLNYTEGKNITSAGVIVDDETSCLSELVPLTWTWDSTTNNRFYFNKAEGQPDSYYIIVFYDENQNYLGFKGSAGTEYRAAPGFDGSAFVRFSFRKGTVGKLTDRTGNTTYWTAQGIVTQKGLVQNVGNLTDLDTTDKDSLVDAINEVKSDTDTVTGVVDAIDVRVSRDHDAVFKETTVETSGTGTATAGTGIKSQTHLVDVEIPSGSTYRFVLNTTGNPFTVYHFYANNTNVRGSCYPGKEYEFTASTDITWVSIYVESENVLADGQFTGVVTKVTHNEDSFEERIEAVEAGASDIDLLKGMVDADVLLYEKEYEVGANINNDGTRTYIYHEWSFNIDDTQMVVIRCDSVEGATSVVPFKLIFRDANNNTLLQKSIYAKQAYNGFSALPPTGTVRLILNLYPSITGGLTDEPAVFTNVVLYTSNDGRFAIKKQSVPNLYQIPCYYHADDYIQNKIDTIEGLIADSDGNCDVFFFCTDQHWTLNAKQSPNLINHICQQIPIPRMFMGGDYADGIDLNALKAFRDAYPGRIYDVIGNHEFFDNFTPLGGIIGQKTISNGDIYAYINMHLTDAISDNLGRGYYYVDNPVQKMRYIILSIFDDVGGTVAVSFESAQKTWLQNNALNLPSGYTAVIFAHVLYTVNYDTGAVVSTAATSDILSVVDNYSGDGEIACMVAGHTHVDGMTVTPGGIPVFITTCDKSRAWISSGTDREPWLTANRHKGTITEQAFDVVVIDKTNRLISFVRIGAKADNGTDPKLEIRQQSY